MSRSKITTGTEAAQELLKTPEGRAKVGEILAEFGIGEHKGAEPSPSPGTPRARPATFSKARIAVTNRHLPDVIADAWQAELSTPIGPDSLFTRDGQVVRLVRGRRGALRIVDVSQAALKTRLHNVAEFVAPSASKDDVTGVVTYYDRPAGIPRDAPAMMLEAPHRDLPELEAVITTPVFGASGNLIARPGYHADDRLWYAADGLALEDVPLVPTAEELREAMDWVREPFAEFLFASESDRTHAIAALVLPFARRLVPGPTPLHLIESAANGTGKSMIAGVVSIAASGVGIDGVTFDRDEAETRKKITMLLKRGAPTTLIDNVAGGLDSAALAAVLTCEVWTDRELGSNREVSAANLTTWIATAKNPKVTTEIARRVARVRILTDVARPQDKTDWRHPDLLQWARDNRAELVRAVLVMVRAWQAAGEPAGKGALGSFEGWVKVIGGILQHAGCGGFLESSRELYDLADVEGAEWRAFVGAWYGRHKRDTVTATTLLKLIDEADLLTAVVSGLENERAKKTRFSRAIGKERDRVFDVFDGDGVATTVKLIIGEDKKTKARVYRLAAPSESAGAGGLL